MLNSTEHDIKPGHNVKMPTSIGILTFNSRIITTFESFKEFKNLYFFIILLSMRN